jgi:hypothetical protein
MSTKVEPRGYKQQMHNKQGDWVSNKVFQQRKAQNWMDSLLNSIRLLKN